MLRNCSAFVQGCQYYQPNGPSRLSICHQRAVHKRKISSIVLNTNTYFVINCNVLALSTFNALPSGGKLKDAVVHSTILDSFVD